MCSLIHPAVWQKTDQKHDRTTGIHWNFLWAASSDPFTVLTHTSPSPWLSSVIKSSPIALPNHYSGSLEDCSDIYLQCELYMPDQFTTDVSKISFIISLLDGKALSSAEWIWVAGGSLTSTLRLFLEHFRGLFGQKWTFSQDRFLRLRQGRSSIADNAIQFQTLVVQCLAVSAQLQLLHTSLPIPDQPLRSLKPFRCISKVFRRFQKNKDETSIRAFIVEGPVIVVYPVHLSWPALSTVHTPDSVN